jgi:hypothetical protein
LCSQGQGQDKLSVSKNEGEKMKKTLLLTIAAVMMALGANGAWADGPFPAPVTDGYFGPAGSATPNSNSGEFEIYNAVNLLLNTSYTNNAQIDNLEYTGDASTWGQAGSGGYAVIGLGAAATNTLQVYNVSTPNTLINPIGTGFTGNGSTGNGTIGSPYVGTGSVFSSGTQFGFAINSAFTSNSTWYSNSALNSDGMDHMLVYNLSSLAGTTVYVYDPNTNTEQPVVLNDPYLLAFEDMPETNSVTGAPSDLDYDDLIVLVDGVAPVPEPTTVALFGLGLLAMAGFDFRRKLAFLA